MKRKKCGSKWDMNSWTFNLLIRLSTTRAGTFKCYLAQLLDDGLREEGGKVSAGVAAIGVGDVFGVADDGLLEKIGGELLVVDERAQVLRLRDEEAAEEQEPGQDVQLHHGDCKQIQVMLERGSLAQWLAYALQD